MAYAIDPKGMDKMIDKVTIKRPALYRYFIVTGSERFYQ
jgi:hypothetical protein